MLEPGKILLVDCPLVDPPHDKFVIVLCLEPKPLFVFINSEIRRFIRERPFLLDAQVKIDCENHGCLNYDSYVDCSEPFTWEIAAFEEQLQQDPGRNKGFCTKVVLMDMFAAIEASTTIPPRNKAWIANALTPLIASD